MKGEEIWKSIPGYEGVYEASNLGRIRSVDGKITYSKKHGKRVWKGKIMKPKPPAPDGSTRITLWKDGGAKDFLVHRLVAMAFNGLPPTEKHTVNHKDGNRYNNNADNLEWLTLADNIRHGMVTGLYKNNKCVILVEKESGKEYEFCSQASAALFLERDDKYISNCIKRGALARGRDGREYLVRKCR